MCAITSIAAVLCALVVIGVVQVTRWFVVIGRRSIAFSTWIGTAQAWVGWPILLAVATYMLTLLALQAR